jgi:hypothetical protein
MAKALDGHLMLIGKEFKIEVNNVSNEIPMSQYTNQWNPQTGGFHFAVKKSN